MQLLLDRLSFSSSTPSGNPQQMECYGIYLLGLTVDPDPVSVITFDEHAVPPLVHVHRDLATPDLDRAVRLAADSDANSREFGRGAEPEGRVREQRSMYPFKFKGGYRFREAGHAWNSYS